ncbi:MAG: hypothetical protein LAQ69_38965 [Acidobacteriia bacterium]|nr:hypothetical protein [Terriglobia bacterium]
MTPEERFERIDATLQKSADLQVELQEAMKGVIQIQKRFAESISQYADAAEQRMDAAEERAARIDESVVRVNKSIADYMDASNARMKRLEENLDALIRAITAEHSNGKGKA